LFGVSCTSRAACTAVGYYEYLRTQGGNAWVALAERWNGSHWSIQTVPTPGPMDYPRLDMVSCGSNSACAAIGDTQDTTFFERWDGARWSTTSVIPDAPNYPVFSDVSCASATACTAVGSSYPTGESLLELTLAERWDGTSWSVLPTSTPFANSGGLDAVSCPSTTACTAVGDFVNQSGSIALVAEQWTAPPTIPPTEPPEVTG
jgi:hypothetical protein